jgi:hypothetical protein
VPTVEELQAKAENFRQEAIKADPVYWTAKAEMAQAEAEQLADSQERDLTALRMTHTERMADFDSATATLVEAMGIFIQASAEYHLTYESASAASRLLSGAGEAAAQRPIRLSGRQKQGDYDVRALLSDFRATTARPL